MTIKTNAPSVEAVSKKIYETVDKLLVGVNQANSVKANLVTSFKAVEIRPGSQVEIAFPQDV